MTEGSLTDKKWLSERDAARYLHVSQASLRRWRAEGKSPSKVDCAPPPCFSCGSRYLYNQKALDEWLFSLQVPAAREKQREGDYNEF